MTVAQLETPSRAERQSTAVGVSAEAEQLAQLLGRVRLDSLSSEVLSPGRRNALNALVGAFLDARQPGWDGYDASPVTEAALKAAIRVLLAVPNELPAPEVGADRDGEMTLEWFRAANRVLSVSVSPAGLLRYGALFPDRPTHGQVHMGVELPNEIVEQIRRVFVS